MKKIAGACAALFVVLGFLAPATQAEVCLDFTEFVDGLEITITGDVITGWWRNFDGEGNSIPIRGIVRDGLELPCNQGPSRCGEECAQKPAKAGIACIWDDGCLGLFAEADWYFYLDELDGTMDASNDFFGDDGPPGTCGIDDVPYEVILGPCPFGPDGKGSSPGITLQQAIRARLDQR